VILVDTNVLLLATTEGPQQARAAKWLEDQFWKQDRVGLPWAVLFAWARLATNARIFPKPVPMAAAWAQVQEWLSLEAAWVPEPTERHAQVVAELIAAGRVTSSNLLPDVHLAALAVEHGLTVCTIDADFARFKAAKWVNPLA